MSYYEILLFLHIATAIVWLGAGLFMQVIIVRGQQTGNDGLLQGIASSSGWFAQRLFIPASLAVLVLGILLTIEGPWSFGDLWIVLGLVGYAFSFLVGILFLEPEGKRIGAAMAAGRDEEARTRVARINAASRIELTVLYLVVASMALKPTGDDVGTLVLFAAALLGAAALWGRSLRAPAAATA
jgi:uncharacterized membrane protein